MTNEELVRQIQAGDKTLLGHLWEQNQGMVNKIAWSYTNSSNPPDDRGGKKFPNPDILQELYLTLIDAVDSYSPDKGCVFLTYYNRMAEWHMIRYFKNQSLIKGCPDDVLSLDYTYNADGDSMADFISDDNEAADSVTDNLYREELQQIWNIARNHTTSREYAVIDHKYRNGTADLSISRQRQHELEKSALRKLRRCKRLQEIAGIDTGQTHHYYMGGFSRWRDRQESCVEFVATENVLRERNRKKRKPKKQEDISLIEKELESLFGIPV